MLIHPQNNRKQVNWLVIIARIWTAGVAGFWGVVLLAHLIGGDDPYAVAETAALQGIVLSILVVSALLATVYAWRDERGGGFALVAIGGMLTVFALVTAGHNHLFAMMISGVPFVLGGLLFLAGWINADV